jgi:small subunit ribosomal protein S2
MPYVNHRWLGGLLTNWRTMADRIDRLHEMRRLRDEGQLELLPAKERIAMGGELEKLEQNLGGVADMRRQPDAVVIVDLKKEALAVREARRLGIPVVALVDTNCDPDEADYVIPGNDDAIRSCLLVVHALASAVSDGKQKVSAQELQQKADEASATEEPAPDRDVEDVRAGEQIEPVTEGESVPVPTGKDPAKEGAEETKRSAAALGDPTKAGSVAGKADDARPEDPAASGGRGGEKEEA